MEEQNLKKHIEEFLKDIDILDDLNKWNREINFFEITGIVKAEIRHSNFLSWLFDPNETHGLRDTFIRRFLNQVFYDAGVSIIDVSMLDYYSFEVRREWQNIDLLLLSSEEQVVISIENKVQSTESKGQLEKYRKIVDANFPEYKKYFIYLTLEGEEPSEPEHWMVATYAHVEEQLSTILKLTNAISNESRQIINNYISMIRRNLLMDKELQDLCWKIYRKHKTALKTIFDVTQDNTSILSSEIKSLLEMNQNEWGVLYNPAFSSTTVIRFSTPYMDNLMPKELAGYGWNNGYKFLYEFQIRKNGVFLIGVTSDQSDPIAIKLKEYAKLNSRKYNLRVSNTSSIWTIVFKVSYVLKPLDIEGGAEEYSEKLYSQMESSIKKDLVAFEKGFEDFLKLPNGQQQ
jgi:hypothetical protein